MKKGFMSTAKKAQIALAVLAAVSCSFISAGSVSAEDTVESLATRVAALESKLSSETVVIGKSADTSGSTGVAIGYSATTNGENNYAIGREAKTNNTWAEGANCNLIANGKGYNQTTNQNWKTGTYSSSKTDENTGVITYYAEDGTTVLGTNENWVEGKNYDYSVTTGDGDAATTTYYLEATQAKADTVAIGTKASAIGANSYAIGSSATVAGAGSYAIGVGASSTGTGSYAIGNYSSATAQDAFSFGNRAKATDRFTTAIGTYAKAEKEYGTAVGFKAHAAVDHAVAIGDSSVATEARTVSFGTKAGDVDGNGSVLGERTSRLVNVTAGRDNTDATNLSQVITNVKLNGNTIEFYTGATDSTTGTATHKTAWDIKLPTSTTGGVSVDGQVASNNTNAVSGDTIYNEVRPTTNGTYVKTDKTTAQNLSALDSAIGDTSALATTVKDKDGNALATEKQNVAGYLDAINGKADQNATNIGNMNNLKVTDANGEKATNLVDAVNAVNDKVASIGSSLGDAVSGNYITAKENDGKTATTVNQNLKKLDDAIGEKITKNGNAIKVNASVNDNLKNLDNAIGKVEDLGTILDKDGKALNTPDKDGDTKDTSVVDAVKAVNEKVGDLAEDGNNIAKGQSVNDNLASLDSAVGDTSALAETIKAVDGNALAEDKQNVAGYLDAVNSKVGDLDKDAEYSNIEAGASLSDNLASLDSAVGTTNDGAYVSAANSVGANLNALDSQVATNTKAIARVNDKVNKVGAGAAALAALHPLDFNPDDKLTFAAGFGNYMGENAVAVGAFYRPNEDVMFSVAGNMGNGENMVNAGVSFALGSGSKATTSKAVMAKKIEAQNEQIGNLTNTVEEQSKEIAELKAMVQALAAK